MHLRIETSSKTVEECAEIIGNYSLCNVMVRDNAGVVIIEADGSTSELIKLSVAIPHESVEIVTVTRG